MKLIAFDLDGTLFDDDKHIPPENLRALEAAADRGFVLVPATGRMVPGIPENVRSLPFCRYYIVSTRRRTGSCSGRISRRSWPSAAASTWTACR